MIFTLVELPVHSPLSSPTPLPSYLESRSLPSTEAQAEARAAGFRYAYSPNHWSNQITTRLHVLEVVVPFLGARRRELGLPADFPAVWIIDCWSVHISQEFRAFMAEKHPEIRLLYVPANCTGRMQPADLSGQKELKTGIRAMGTRYASLRVRDRLQELQRLPPDEREKEMAAGIKIDTSITAIKPFLPGWHLWVMKRLERRQTLLKGWQKSRLLEAFDPVGGHQRYRLAAVKNADGTLWSGAVAVDGVHIPTAVTRVRVAKDKKDEATGATVFVEEEVDVLEPRESEAEIALALEDEARRAELGEKVSGREVGSCLSVTCMCASVC